MGEIFDSNIIGKKTIKSEIDKTKLERTLISTSSKNFNKVIGGGFISGKVYVVFGANKTGKTQICHQLSVQAFEKSFKVVYLDTENTFRPERVQQLAESNKYDSNKTLKNIYVSKIMSNNALLLKLNEMDLMIKSSNVRLLIVDSINNFFRIERIDKQISFLKAKTTFIKILEKINNLTQRFQLITILTAQVTPNFNEDAVVKEFPVGIQYLNHFFSEVLYLSYKEQDKVYIHLVNSHFLPEKKVVYSITKRGIEDYKM
ncbi:MAG: AAA family ATPase [Candidatus Lokiarchaeota archaeon]|nr:AAA family ATPase [Candidatus Lokiarchaeota archaeon]